MNVSPPCWTSADWPSFCGSTASAKQSAAEAPAKLLASFLRKSDEGTLERLLVEMVILHTADSPNDSGKVLREAADYYKVDVDAITAKVKQEFAAKEKSKAVKKAAPKPPAKAVKKTVAA